MGTFFDNTVLTSQRNTHTNCYLHPSTIRRNIMHTSYITKYSINTFIMYTYIYKCFIACIIFNYFWCSALFLYQLLLMVLSLFNVFSHIIFLQLLLRFFFKIFGEAFKKCLLVLKGYCLPVR